MPGGSEALGRIVRAYELAVVQLRGFDAVAAELLRRDTELALCVVLAVFAGVGVPGLGTVSESILSLKQGLNLGGAGKQLDAATVSASAAAQESELRGSASLMAQAIQALGPERIAPLLQSGAFSQLRSYLAPMRSALLRDAGSTPGTTAGGRHVGPVQAAGFSAAVWWVAGTAAAVGLALLAVGSVPRRKVSDGYG